MLPLMLKFCHSGAGLAFRLYEVQNSIVVSSRPLRLNMRVSGMVRYERFSSLLAWAMLYSFRIAVKYTQSSNH